MSTGDPIRYPYPEFYATYPEIKTPITPCSLCAAGNTPTSYKKKVELNRIYGNFSPIPNVRNLNGIIYPSEEELMKVKIPMEIVTVKNRNTKEQDEEISKWKINLNWKGIDCTVEDELEVNEEAINELINIITKERKNAILKQYSPILPKRILTGSDESTEKYVSPYNMDMYFQVEELHKKVNEEIIKEIEDEIANTMMIPKEVLHHPDPIDSSLPWYSYAGLNPGVKVDPRANVKQTVPVQSGLGKAITNKNILNNSNISWNKQANGFMSNKYCFFQYHSKDGKMDSEPYFFVGLKDGKRVWSKTWQQSMTFDSMKEVEDYINKNFNGNRDKKMKACIYG